MPRKKRDRPKLKPGPKGPRKTLDRPIPPVDPPAQKVDDPKPLTMWDQLNSLCEMQGTEAEAAAVLGMDVVTLRERIKEKGYGDFSQYFEKHSAQGKSSLRRKQFSVAMAGNSRMLTWLGEHWLDQKRTHDVNLRGSLGTRPMLDLSKLSEPEARALLELMKKAEADGDQGPGDAPAA